LKNIIITAAVVLVLVVAIGWVVLGRSKNGADPALAKKVEVVERGDFQMSIRATGNLEPLIDVEVKSNVEGEIVGLHVKNGEYVEEGQVLIELDPELYEEEKKQAEADVRAAKAQLKQADLNILLKKERLGSQLVQAESDFKIAQANFETTQASTITQINQAETDILTAKNSLDQITSLWSKPESRLNRQKLRYLKMKHRSDLQRFPWITPSQNLIGTQSSLKRDWFPKRHWKTHKRSTPMRKSNMKMPVHGWTHRKNRSLHKRKQ